MVDLSLQKRIKARVAIDARGCWLWLGAKRPTGYGNIVIRTKTHSAHRASWVAFNGDIPGGLFVCHKCDVPACVNPDHLFLGTQKENMADMNDKGRRVVAPKHGENNPMYGKSHSAHSRRLQADSKAGRFVGSNHPKAKITEEIAVEIKKKKGTMTAKAVAELLGVSFHVVRNIWSGKSWGFING